MQNLVKRITPAATVLVLIVLASAFLSAQSPYGPPTAPNGKGRSGDEPSTASLAGRNLVKTTINYDNPQLGVALTIGPQGLDNVTTITCPGTTGTCTFAAEMNVQLGFGGDGPFGMCLAVDGNIVNGGGCPTLGIIPASNWSSASFSEATANVPHGTHTVQTIIWPLSNSADRGYYTINYRVYRP